jgi:hypothetical protein
MERVEILLARDAEPPQGDGRLAQLHAYWRSICPDARTLPGRQHFEPLMVPRLLPWIWLIDVSHDPLRFRYRLIGTIHVDACGWNQTGLYLDQVHPRFIGSSAYPQFCAVAERGDLAFYAGAPTYVIKKDYISIERLIMPLARDGTVVDMLLGITVLHSAFDLATRAAENHPPAPARRPVNAA